MSKTEQLVKRSRKVAFMDVSTTSIANFLRMTKFTEISKSKNPTEYSRSYVDEDGEVTDVTGYSEEISYNFDLHVGNLVHEKLVDITDNEKTGADALVRILQVDFTKPRGTGYEARLRTYSVVPDQIEAGTFMTAAVATKGDIMIKNVIPKHLEAISEIITTKCKRCDSVLGCLGCIFSQGEMKGDIEHARELIKKII